MFNGSQKFEMIGGHVVDIRLAYILVHRTYSVPCLVDTDELVVSERPMRRTADQLDRRFLVFTETKQLNRYVAHCLHNEPQLTDLLEVWRVSTPTHILYPCRMKSANAVSKYIQAYFASHIVPIKPVKLDPTRSPFFKVEMCALIQHEK